MNPQKRTRRGRVQRAVSPDEPRKPRVSKLKPKPEPSGEPTKRTRKPHIRRKRKGA